METKTKYLGKVSITVEKNYHTLAKEYDRLCVVEERGSGFSYISRKPVPLDTPLNNREYWIKIGYSKNDMTELLTPINQAIEDLKLNKLDAEYLTLLATKEEIEDMVKSDDLTDFVKTSTLDDYAKKTDLDSKADITALDDYAKKDKLDEIITNVNNISNKPILAVDPNTLATKTELANKADISDLAKKANKEDIITDYNALKNRPTKLSQFYNDLHATHISIDSGNGCDRCDSTVENEILKLKNLISELDQKKLDADNFNGGTLDDTSAIAQIAANKQNIETLQSTSATKTELAQYAKTSALDDYVKKTTLSDYAKTSELSSYATNEKLKEYAKTSALDNYLKKTDYKEPIQSDWNIEDKDSLAYIKNKPVIKEQVQANWEETNPESKAFILNKPTIPDEVNLQPLSDRVSALESAYDDLLTKYNTALDKIIALEEKVKNVVTSTDISSITKIDPHEYSHALPGTLDDKTLYLVTD